MNARAATLLTVSIPLATCSIAPAADRVTFTIDAQKDVRPISRFIYGVNQPIDGPYAGAAFARIGGNRITAYNWTNNASNAGNDWHFQNDGFLGGGDAPGGAMRAALDNAATHGAGIVVTVPMAGYVAADKRGDGDVHASGPDYLETRFRPAVARKGAAFTLTPPADAPRVYADEFVNWVKSNYGWGFGPAAGQHPICFALDNEPDLWSSTHKEIHPDPVTYAELVERSIDYAKAIKDVAPNAKIFGPVNYGWQGFVNLQKAPDANGRDFQSFYLAQMKAAEQKAGRRLLDVFDVHWYPEAQGNGVRITGRDASPSVAAARMQAPRSLWDKTYTETSWITQWQTKGSIALLPRLREKIDANYPGTLLAMTEYNFGGGAHISGAIAEADVLGILGRSGLFAANEWPMEKDESFIAAGFRMFRDYDGNGAAFGDTSVAAETSDIEATSLYASTDAKGGKRMVLVAINKTDHAINASVKLEHARHYSTVQVYHLTADAPTPKSAGGIEGTDLAAFGYTLPPMSVVTIELK